MAPGTERVATVAGNDGSAVQALLAAMVRRWRAAGARIAGVIAEAHGLPGRTCGAGFLRDIASGKPHSIYLETVTSGTTCHLDAAGVAGACAAILDQIPASDLVVLNKFGKLEAMRGGLAPAFEAAVAAGKPVLTTVSDLHREAWHAFAPDAVALAADPAALQDWWRAVRSGEARQGGVPAAAERHGAA